MSPIIHDSRANVAGVTLPDEPIPDRETAEAKLAKLEEQKAKAMRLAQQAQERIPSTAEIEAAKRDVERSAAEERRQQALDVLIQHARDVATANDAEAQELAALEAAIATSPLGAIIRARRARQDAANAFERSLKDRVPNVHKLYGAPDEATQAALNAALAEVASATDEATLAAVRQALPHNHPAGMDPQPRAGSEYQPLIEALVGLAVPRPFAVGRTVNTEDELLRLRAASTP